MTVRVGESALGASGAGASTALLEICRALRTVAWLTPTCFAISLSDNSGLIRTAISAARCLSPGLRLRAVCSLFAPVASQRASSRVPVVTSASILGTPEKWLPHVRARTVLEAPPPSLKPRATARQRGFRLR